MDGERAPEGTWSVERIAQARGVSPQAVRAALQSGKLAGTRPLVDGRRTWVVLDADARRYLADAGEVRTSGRSPGSRSTETMPPAAVEAPVHRLHLAVPESETDEDTDWDETPVAPGWVLAREISELRERLEDVTRERDSLHAALTALLDGLGPRLRVGP